MTFSMDPFCHDEYGSQKNTGKPNVLYWAFSVPRSRVSVRRRGASTIFRRFRIAFAVCAADLSWHFVKSTKRDFLSCCTQTMAPFFRLPSMESPSQSPKRLREETAFGRSSMRGTTPSPCVPLDAFNRQRLRCLRGLPLGRCSTSFSLYAHW